MDNLETRATLSTSHRTKTNTTQTTKKGRDKTRCSPQLEQKW